MRSLAILGSSILLFSAIALATTASTPASSGGYCARYANETTYVQALQKVAKSLLYSYDDLCNLGRLADIHVTERAILNEKEEAIPHVWVTLHYAEYSCQYFVRESDFEVTRKNCYNTF